MPEDITRELTEYIRTIRDNGGIVNTAIVIAAGLGMVKRKDPTLLECNGGYVTLKKSWAKYLLNKMNYVKRRATTKVFSRRYTNNCFIPVLYRQRHLLCNHHLVQ